MIWCRFAIIALAAQLVESVYGYGTTVEVFVSYCPAIYTGSIFGGGNASSTYASTSVTTGAPSSPSSGSYFLAVNNGVDEPDEYVADDGTLTANASLAVAFTIDSSGQLMGGGGYISTSGSATTQKFAVNATLGSISTLFSIVNDNAHGRRDASSSGGTLQWQNETFGGGQAIFCMYGSIVQVSFNGQAPAGCEEVTLDAVPVGDIISSSGTSVSMGSTSMPTSGYTSAPNGLTTTPNALSSGMSPTTTPSTGISGTATSLPMGSTPMYGSSTSASTSSTVSAYPTSTGPPSCDDRSSYDGTVDDGYLILCDTDLPGYDLLSVPASDLADCIGTCNSYVTSSDAICLAVTYNSSTATDPCTLKSNINTVNRGADAYVQAAIVVDKPYAPTIDFASAGSSGASSTNVQTSAVSSTTTVMSTSTLMGTSSTSVTTTASTTHLVSSVLSTQQSSAPTTTSQTSTPLSTTAQMSSSLSTTRAPPSSTPTMSSSSATTTPSSSPATSHITSTSQTASQMSTVATSTQTTSSTGLSTTRSATTTTTTTTTASYCSATPTTTNLCPTYNHQALNVNGDGSCYEVECSTALQGTQLTGNSTTATSLKTCTAVCNIYNEAIPYGCVGVSFYNSVTGSSPNCILFSSITGTSSTSGVDSGRLMYQGYPSITDPSYAAITTTTAVTTTSAAVTSGTTTTSTTLTSCPPAPTASSCPGNSPYCYAYEYNGNTDDFEVECQTSFTGVALQAIIAFDFEDCAGWCQYANEQGRDVPGDVQGSNCVGFTFQEIPVYTQGGPNNCFRYSSLTCATRNVGSTFDSGRLLFSGYPNMTDYSGSAFHC